MKTDYESLSVVFNIKQKIMLWEPCIYSSSRLNAHLMFQFFPENWKSILVVKTFKNCNPPDVKCYPSKLTNEIVPIWCNVKFSLLLCIVYCSENRFKINSTHGEFFYDFT